MTKFRKLFNNGEPIDAVVYIKSAKSVITEEVANEINRKNSRLIELAKYLAANVTPHRDTFEIYKLIQEVYGFVGRYEDAW